MFTPSEYAPQQTFLLRGDEEYFERLCVHLAAHDLFVQTLSVPRLTIEHAHELATYLSESTAEERTSVVYFSVFSPEAAQVLLKSLEEPAPRTTLLFVTRYPYLIPQTVRSRMMLFSENDVEKEKEGLSALVALIEKEAGEKEDKADPATRRDRALVLLDRIERATATYRSDAVAVYDAKRMLFRGNLPTKFVLDYVATVLHK